MRNKVLHALVILLISAKLGNAQTKTFSMPDSVLLFSNYDQGLVLITPESSLLIRVPAGASRALPVATASLGSSGTHIAWGFPVADDKEHAGRVRCAVGLYSVVDQKWRTFGDFSSVLTTAISPDETKIAFVATQGYNAEVRHLTLILDLETGNIRELPRIAGPFSWSPDGKQLAVGSVIITLSDTPSVSEPLFKNAESPTWSPEGDWLAYVASSKQEIHLVHPDGTGDRVVKNVKHHVFGYRFFAMSPVWSPNGTELLLNEYKADGDSEDVVLLDIKTGKTTTKSTNGNPILGWARRHG